MIDLDKENLTNIIQVFGKDGKIFQSEAQFQFELAWSLQTHLGCQVKLEDMRTVVRSKDNNPEALKKKFYTDIVVEQDGYSVALELKYKTADYSDKNLYLFNHGAVDLGRYDYLWDVHRIELLLGKGYKKELLFGPCSCPCTCRSAQADASDRYCHSGAPRRRACTFPCCGTSSQDAASRDRVCTLPRHG